MGKETGFLEIDRRERDYIAPEKRLANYREFIQTPPDDVLPIATSDEGSERSWGEPQQRPVSVDNSGMGDPLYHDAARLRILVERHHLHTDSARAKALLDDWDNALGKFRKVMPRDYARALKALEEEREDAAMEAAE